MKCFLVASAVLVSLVPVFAESVTSTSANTEWRENFMAGETEMGVGGFIYFSPALSLSGRPTINYAGGLAQVGYMLTDATALGSWSGNFEGLAEGYAARIYQGDGDYMAGTTLWIRYNFVPPRWKLVPFFQAGAGITFTDADRTVLGQDFNFNLNLGAGVRYFVTDRCSINAEYRYQHISNAGMHDVNLGIDGQGGVLSVSWFF